jgi:hypothetical protein
MAIDLDKEAAEFADELEHGKYKMVRSQNTEEDYTEAKEKRDFQAYKEFLETDLFAHISNLT